MPTVTLQATGAHPSVGYEPLSGKNGCTSDLRSMGSATTPYVVLSDEAGNIPPTEGVVHEGGYPRTPDTYDLCFRRTDPNDPSFTAPVQLSIGGAQSTTTTTVPPSGNVCNITIGSGDDEAVEAAIAACANGTSSAPTRVSFPANASYSGDGPINLDDRRHLIIDGNGSSFYSPTRSGAPGMGVFVVLRGTNVTFEDMAVRGGFDLRPANCGSTWTPACSVYDLNRYPDANWESNGGWQFYGTDGGGVRDARANDLWGDGVLTAFDGILDTTVHNSAWQVARNLVVERITVENASRTCAASTQGINITYRDSTFRHCWTWGMDHEADGDANGNLHNKLPIDGIHMLNNIFEGYNYGAITVPVGGDVFQPDPGDRTPVANITIRGNQLRTGPEQAPCQASILIGLPDYSSANRIQNAVTEDNTIVGLTRYVAYNHVDGGSIRNNTFVHRSYGLEPYDDPKIQCSASPGNPVAPMVVNDSTNIVVEGNVGP